MLHIYISTYCGGYSTALRRVEQVRARFPSLAVAVVDVDAPDGDVPRSVIGTPMYLWDDRVLFWGNPAEAELLDRIGALHDDQG